ncbi:hypothetical protein [Glutamicibacter nicotianae]|uniref:hypothetical protein n=1 Tax=Glutamicibacter nicotianae TaxID=37929 RepID=UPI0025529CE1|nr:hypothetical protein [Glutamicibacter nicotianae]WIV43054.1 hypothetical protein QQS42_12120 [Glutamicibacter nicotianae]
MATPELLAQADELFYSSMSKRAAANAILEYEDLHDEAGSNLMDLNNGLFNGLSDAALKKLIDGAPAYMARESRAPELGLEAAHYAELQEQVRQGQTVPLDALTTAASKAAAEALHSSLNTEGAEQRAKVISERAKRRQAALDAARKSLPTPPTKEEVEEALQVVKDAVAAVRQLVDPYDKALDVVRQTMENGDVLRTDFDAPKPEYFDQEADYDNTPFAPGRGLTMDGKEHRPLSGTVRDQLKAILGS